MSRPESSTASAAAPTANRTARLIIFTFFLILTQERQNVEVLHFSRDLDALARRVETLDVIHTGSALKDRVAEVATAQPIGRNNADSGHHHAVHFFPHAQSLQSLKGAVRVISSSSALIPPWSAQLN